jgi:cytochrome c peroxidase
MKTPLCRRVRGAALALLIAGLALSGDLSAAPASGADQSVLPPGTDLGEGQTRAPREQFHSEFSGGQKPYLVKLGNLLFSSPQIMGPVARQAGISCETCHAGGTTNPRFFIPGASEKPGTFDTTSALFNPKTDDARLDALRIPSLRGLRFLGPYGHDGRTASLRDFVRDVIVKEFAGPEPEPRVVDAIVAYLQDIDFLTNPRISAEGRLAGNATAAERRGEEIFERPFPQNPGVSCASCHPPSAGFTDHRQHDVHSGGPERTPTLLNANFNAPYFHDGRFDGYAGVVDHFNRVFTLGLDASAQGDLVAYLTAVGDGWNPYEPAGIDDTMEELEDFESVLETAINERDRTVVALAVDVIGSELREMVERFPDHKSTAFPEGKAARAKARGALKGLILRLRELELQASGMRFDLAGKALEAYREELEAAMPALHGAERYSLYDPDFSRAFLAAVKTAREGTGQ